MNPLTHGTLPAGWKAPQDDLANEVTIWQNEIQEGWFNKRTVQAQVITNKRIILDVSSVILLQDLVSVTSINSHRETKGQGARLYARGTGMSYGTSKYSGSTYGDIMFIDNHSNQITFNNVPDPSGVVRLVKSTSKGLVDMMKKNPPPQAQHTDYYQDQDNKFTGGRIDESEHPYEATPYDPEDWFDGSPEKIKLLNERLLATGVYTANQSRCPKDQLLNPGILRFCILCGTKLIVQRTPEEEKEINEHPERCSYCPRDGAIQMSKWMRYCGLCGTEMIPIQKESLNICKCGVKNSSGARFCNSCGFTLR